MPAFKLARAVLTWHQQHGRHDLPWQQPRTPYRVWVSEIMLQQTQVRTAINYFEAFVAMFPDLLALAQAPSEQVMQQWAGLGYYSRARNLHKSAQICATQYGAQLPTRFEDLICLPGIGRSTAGAILSQAHGLPFAILDGNVKRVLTRFHCVEGSLNSSATSKQLWQLAEIHLPKKDLANYSQAMMDLGATVCTSRNPNCKACPLAKQCQAYQANRVDDFPNKSVRKAIPKRNVYVLLMINKNNEILLEQRPNHGIWGGLFSLPEANDLQQAKTIISQHIIRPKTEQFLNSFNHQFSHFQLCIKPIVWQNCVAKHQIKDNTSLRWVSRQQLAKIGLPAPIKTLLLDLP
ncbi:MAG: A/G-specific adenine glycosylase [Arenimonas sp.]|nr:A/G-specific adenine glycosylase [Arenimonas sp.]